jgi:hypothetical protein
MNTNYHYKILVDSLKLLALPYAEQKKMFPNFVYCPLEIVDTFSDAFLLLPMIIEANLLSNIAIAHLVRIKIYFDERMNDSDFDYTNELDYELNEKWVNLRLLAKNTLDIL